MEGVARADVVATAFEHQEGGKYHQEEHASETLPVVWTRAPVVLEGLLPSLRPLLLPSLRPHCSDNRLRHGRRDGHLGVDGLRKRLVEGLCHRARHVCGIRGAGPSRVELSHCLLAR